MAAAMFAERLKSQAARYIVLVRGSKSGRRCWYYVLSNKVKMPVLLKKCAMKESNLDIEQFGKILKSGWGENPPQYIQDKVEREGAAYDNSEFDVAPGKEDEQFYVETLDENQRKFFIRIDVPAILTKEFEIVVKYGACDFTAYGTIVESGWL